MNTALIDEGLRQIELGRHLLPIGRHKQPHRRSLEATECYDPVRQRTSWTPLRNQQATAEMLHIWVTQGASGLAIVTGAPSKLIAIDVDAGPGMTRLEQWGAELQRSAHVSTPNHGLHFHFVAPAWAVKTLQTHTGTVADAVRGIDIRGDGGYIIIPPTNTEHGQYRWKRPTDQLLDLSLLPNAVQQAFGLDAPPPMPEPAPPRTPLNVSSDLRDIIWERILDEALRKALNGEGRNTAFFWACCQLRDNDFPRDEARRLYHLFTLHGPQHNTKGEREPYGLAEGENAITSAYAAAARNPWNMENGQPQPTPALAPAPPPPPSPITRSVPAPHQPGPASNKTLSTLHHLSQRELFELLDTYWETFSNQEQQEALTHLKSWVCKRSADFLARHAEPLLSEGQGQGRQGIETLLTKCYTKEP